jgi:cell wall-associated NlpC family hydrolase
VFDAQGPRLRVQETSFAMTRRALEGLATLPSPARPAAIRMRQMSPSTYQVQAPKGGMLGAQAVAIARQYLGIPYVWGGASPQGGFDCSGLVMYVYAKLGVRLDHYAAFQFHEGTPVAPGDLQPGDLVFFEPTASGPGHVGMYIGGTEFIQAPHTGDVVKISSISGWYASTYVGARRI